MVDTEIKIQVIKALTEECHKNAVERGWWDHPRNDGEFIALIHSELSEALEWLRNNPESKSDHISDFLGIEEEFADVLIWIFDYSAARNLDLGGALIAKMQFNNSRPHRHGKRF